MEKNMEKRKKTKNNYVNNTKMLEEIIKYKERVKEAKEKGLDEPRIPEYLGQCILLIAQRVSMLSKFSGYSFREEIVSDGIENMVMYFNNFDPEKSSNPFAYFTQIVYYAAYRRITKEEKNRYALYKRFQESTLSNAELFVDSDDTSLISASVYDNINEFIERFEAKDAKKREKRKQYKNKTIEPFFDGDEGE